MLAIHRPRMGSTQPSDPDLPFGYTLDPSSQDFFFLEAPEPAPGAPLLNENDARLLNSFFDNMTSDQFGNFGEGLNFSEDWLSLPPQFMGTATSFGQQSNAPLGSPIHGLPNVTFPEPLSSPASLMPPPPPPPPPPAPSMGPHPPPNLEHASADVLAAATLLQNGSLPRAHAPHGGNHEPMYNRTIPMGAAPADHLRHHQGVVDFRGHSGNGRRGQQSHLMSPHEDHDSTFADMMFGGAAAVRQPTPRPNNPPAVEVRWGSDESFNKVGFVPHSTKETGEALENERLKYIECLEVSRSAATTRPPSPAMNGDSSPLNLKTRVQSTPIKPDPDSHGPARKRRRSSKVKDDAEDDDDDELPTPSTAAPKTARKRKSKVDVSTTPPSESSGKRRKSNANGVPKPSRENLTEEQKRENHIKSEQKRRTLIKEGFDDLCDLVPGLKGGGFSKSTMLSMAADWLEEIMRGNEELRQMAGLAV